MWKGGGGLSGGWRRKIEKKQNKKQKKKKEKKRILDQNINDWKSDALSSFKKQYILFRAYNFIKKVLLES